MKKKRIRCKILDFVLIHARMIHQALGNEPIIERERRRCSMIPDPVLDPNWKTYTTGRNGKDASYSFFPSSRNYIRKSTAVIETQTIFARGCSISLSSSGAFKKISKMKRLVSSSSSFKNLDEASKRKKKN